MIIISAVYRLRDLIQIFFTNSFTLTLTFLYLSPPILSLLFFSFPPSSLLFYSPPNTNHSLLSPIFSSFLPQVPLGYQIISSLPEYQAHEQVFTQLLDQLDRQNLVQSRHKARISLLAHRGDAGARQVRINRI